MKIANEGGFSILEVMIYVAIVGVLLSVAVPKYTTAMTMANTAKIQSDLQAIDTAILMYQMNHGGNPSEIKTDLADYLDRSGELQPPTGNCFLNTGEEVAITASAYTLSDSGDRGLCQGYEKSAFGKGKKNKVEKE